MHYFAYCNLMDIDLMRSVCPSARAIAVARLPDHEMRFAKCSDPAHGGCTLARIEGPRHGACSTSCRTRTWRRWMPRPALRGTMGAQAGHRLYADGQTVETVTYHIPNDRGPHAPTESYVVPIHRGAKALGLPEAYRRRLHAIIAEATAAAS